MTQRTLIIALVVLVLLVLGGWYFFSPTSSEQATQGTDTTQQETNGDDTAMPAASNPSSLRAIVAQGGNYTCSLNTITSDEGTTNGTIYGSGGKTRLDLSTVKTSGARTTVHIIRSGSYSYTWVDGQTTGIKASITASSPIVNQPSGGVISVADDASFSSDCHAWLPDNAQFTLPTTITFTAA